MGANTTDLARICPECGAPIPNGPGPTWCEQCNWNLKAPDRGMPVRLFDRLSERMSGRAADQLFEEVLAQPPTERRMTARELLTVAYALLVHAAAPAMFVGGIALIVWAWPGPGIVLGVIAIFVAISLRPRLGRVPRTAVRPAEVPALAELVARVADSVGAPPVDAFVFHTNLNAAFARVGVRRRNVLWLGMPLWWAASTEERVAILGHELGHSVNGDPARTLVVGSAINALNRWYALFMPQRRILRRTNHSWGDTLVAPFLWVLRGIPRFAGFVLNQLRWTASQRAEYLADAVSARMASSAAAISLLDLLYLDDIFRFLVERSRTYDRDRNPIDVFAARVRNRTPREIERVRRIERLPGSYVDRTHPATWRRIAVIEKLAVARPAIAIDSATRERIDAELTPYKDACARALQAR